MEPREVETVLDAAWPAAEGGDAERAWGHLQPLLEVADADPTAARGLAAVLGWAGLQRERRIALAERLLSRWAAEVSVVSALGSATSGLVDTRYLNAAPPADPFFVAVVEQLVAHFEDAPDVSARALAADGLTTAGRLGGHRWDAVCERAHAFLIAHQPERWHHHYNYGLFLKTRGRFAEGVAANREAARLGGADENAVLWNLGICATAIGDGETAISLWRRLGCKLEIGADGLPAGGWDHVQVHLAQRPLAARDAEHDDPGGEETIWVDRLSPCHGRVVSALYQDLGVDYGDLVLFDGAPIVTRTWGERSVPVFPHIVTLRSGGWYIFAFAATQEQEGQVAELGARLGDGVELYVHSEQYRLVCKACWQREQQGHAHEDRTHHVVTGKLVVPPDLALEMVAEALRDDERGSAHPRVYVPALWAAVGDEARAEVHERRYQMLATARVRERV